MITTTYHQENARQNHNEMPPDTENGPYQKETIVGLI